MAAPFCKFYGKILVSFCLNTGKGCFLEVSFSSQQKEYTLLWKKMLGKIFVGEKFSHFWKTSHFFPSNFSNSSLFPDQFLKLKGLSWVGLLFSQRKVVLLEFTVGITNPWNWVLQIHSFVDITKQKVFVQVNFPRL